MQSVMLVLIGIWVGVPIGCAIAAVLMANDYGNGGAPGTDEKQ